MVTEDDNATIERMISEGRSAIDIRAAVPTVSRTNVYLKIAKFKKHGTVGRVQTKTLGRPRVMGEGVDKFLQGLLAAKPDMELDEMRRHLQAELQLHVSMSTISRAITRAGIATGKTAKTRGVRRRRDKLAAPDGDDHATATDDGDAALHDAAAHADAMSPLEQSNWDHDHLHPHTHTHHHHHQQHHHHTDDLQHIQLQHHDQHQVDPVQHHHHNQHDDIHALDPSLAHVFPPPAMYHAVYAAMPSTPREMAHHGAALASGLGPGLGSGHTSGIDVYRSPYGPI
ncbi:hypothetical protein MBLNU459_g5617t1 [Dothideomycetes sp. NU459]